MREIKFRAWDAANEIMYDSRVLNIMVHFDGKLQVANEQGVLAGTFNVPELELMQYTGLKDKDGNEIFEGDLVKHDMEVDGVWERYEADAIGFDEENAMFVLGDAPITDYRNLEVIGNIYEKSND